MTPARPLPPLPSVPIYLYTYPPKNKKIGKIAELATCVGPGPRPADGTRWGVAVQQKGTLAMLHRTNLPRCNIMLRRNMLHRTSPSVRSLTYRIAA